MKETLICLILTIAFSASLFSQSKTDGLQTPADVARKSLEFLSCEKGEEKDWDEYRNLFLPNAQKLIYKPKSGRPLFQQAMIWNVEEFKVYGGPVYPLTGFEEYVIGLDVKEFNGLAVVFQSFYCKNLDGSYEARGVNSYQMVYLDDRRWIAFTSFVNETDDVKLPNELLFEKYQTKD